MIKYKLEFIEVKRMLKYKIFFTDGSFLRREGTSKNIDNVFHFYGEDKIIKFIIPVSQVKYSEVN